MSNRDTCHGCEGKGWLLIVTVERTSPFFSRDRLSAPPGATMITREFRPDTWATLLLIRTGSKEHNIRLAQRAKELGMKLRASGDGIEDGHGNLMRVDAEEDVFRILGLRYLAPEDRK